MKRLLFLFLLYTGTITTFIRTAADALENSCLVCGTEESLFSLCAKKNNHTLSCKKHCPELFGIKHCSECREGLKPADSLPADFKDEIDARARDIELLALERKIETERVNHIKSHHTSLVDSIAHTFGCRVKPAANRKIVQQTQLAAANRAAQHRAWNLVVSVIAYHRAWQTMIRNPEDDETHTKIDRILKDLPTYEDQETVHLIGNDLGRFQTVHRIVLDSLSHTEGDIADIIPNLKAIALQDMRIIETPL